MKKIDTAWANRQLTKARDIAAAVSLLELSITPGITVHQRRLCRDAFEKSTSLVRQFEALATPDSDATRWAVVDAPEGGGATPAGGGGRVSVARGGIHHGVGEGDAGLYGEPVE